MRTPSKNPHDVCACVIQVSASDCTLGSSIESTYMHQQCSEGYYGPLCSMCVQQDALGNSYGRSGTWSCQKCRSKAGIIGAYVASFLLVLLFLEYTVRVTLKENAEPWPNDHTTAASLLRVTCMPLPDNDHCRQVIMMMMTTMMPSRVQCLLAWQMAVVHAPYFASFQSFRG